MVETRIEAQSGDLDLSGEHELTENLTKHPADSLALALERSSSLLTTITDLYDTGEERFAGGESFVAHAVATVSSLINEARDALADLHSSCDLAMLDQVAEVAMPLDIGAGRTFEVVDHHQSEPDHVVTATASYSDNRAEAHEPQEQFAQSYLELLRKLTAAEIFAAERQALAAPGSDTELLPLLKSLREDLQKLHNAA